MKCKTLYMLTTIIAILCSTLNAENREVKNQFYENGVLKSETPLENNIIDGVVKEYYENGILKKTTTYVDGRKHGILKTYYPSGNLESSVKMWNDRKDGKVKYFHDSAASSIDPKAQRKQPSVEQSLASIAKSQRTQAAISTISFIINIALTVFVLVSI